MDVHLHRVNSNFRYLFWLFPNAAYIKNIIDTEEMNAKPTQKVKEKFVVAKLRNLTATIWRHSVKPVSFRVQKRLWSLLVHLFIGLVLMHLSFYWFLTLDLC